MLKIFEKSNFNVRFLIFFPTLQNSSSWAATNEVWSLFKFIQVYSSLFKFFDDPQTSPNFLVFIALICVVCCFASNGFTSSPLLVCIIFSPLKMLHLPQLSSSSFNSVHCFPSSLLSARVSFQIPRLSALLHSSTLGRRSLFTRLSSIACPKLSGSLHLPQFSTLLPLPHLAARWSMPLTFRCIHFSPYSHFYHLLLCAFNRSW